MIDNCLEELVLLLAHEAVHEELAADLVAEEGQARHLTEGRGILLLLLLLLLLLFLLFSRGRAGATSAEEEVHYYYYYYYYYYTVLF